MQNLVLVFVFSEGRKSISSRTQFIPYPHVDGNTKLRHKEKCINIERVSYFTDISQKTNSRTCCSTKSTLRFRGAAVICSKTLHVNSLPVMSIVFLFCSFSACFIERAQLRFGRSTFISKGA